MNYILPYEANGSKFYCHNHIGVNSICQVNVFCAIYALCFHTGCKLDLKIKCEYILMMSCDFSTKCLP